MGSLDTVVFDKTGTLTTGKFEVTDVSPVRGRKEELLELAALGEHNSNHPIAQSVKQAYGKEADTSRIGQVEEISGHGIHAQVQVDGVWRELYIGNQKFMDQQGVVVSTPAQFWERHCIWRRGQRILVPLSFRQCPPGCSGYAGPV